jgi:hypothetical protein
VHSFGFAEADGKGSESGIAPSGIDLGARIIYTVSLKYIVDQSSIHWMDILYMQGWHNVILTSFIFDRQQSLSLHTIRPLNGNPP